MSVTSNPATGPRSRALYQSLQTFLESSQPPLSDGVLTARIVGEFSAGKTRLLRELLTPLIPPALSPLSSLERQTRLPLEITYGETARLSLIERPEDYSETRYLQDLDQFPERDELSHHDPFRHRLRLALPEPRLILSQGDGCSDDEMPKRLFLIDTPGWNSGDDELAESPEAQKLVGYHNLALIYVCKAERLDSQGNRERLQTFMEHLAEARGDFLQNTRLLFVLTHCPDTEAERFRQRAEACVKTVWSELEQAEDSLELDVFCIDFSGLPENRLDQFRTSFWRSLLQPLGQQAESNIDPWETILRRWPAEWHLDAPLQQTYTLLTRAKTLLDKAIHNGEVIAGMNAHRLLGLDEQHLRTKLRETWCRQLDCKPAEWQDWQAPVLPEGHPLDDWWRSYWQTRVEQVLHPIQHFFQQADDLIQHLTLEQTENLQSHLLQTLSDDYNRAVAAAENGFMPLIDCLPAIIQRPRAERLATLMTLSLLETRYTEYREYHAIKD